MQLVKQRTQKVFYMIRALREGERESECVCVRGTENTPVLGVFMLWHVCVCVWHHKFQHEYNKFRMCK